MVVNYNPNNRHDAYIAELNKLIKQSGPLRAFTDEENIQINRDLNEGINKFLAQDRINKFEAERELSKIVLTD